MIRPLNTPRQPQNVTNLAKLSATERSADSCEQSGPHNRHHALFPGTHMCAVGGYRQAMVDSERMLPSLSLNHAALSLPTLRCLEQRPRFVTRP
jgi:hypothetical protein